KAHSVAEACGSASTTVTDPCRARAVATKMEVTVLDTPPLGFKTVMTVLIPSTIPPDPHNTTWGSGGMAKLCTTERLDMQTYRPKPTGFCDADGRGSRSSTKKERLPGCSRIDARLPPNSTFGEEACIDENTTCRRFSSSWNPALRRRARTA